MKRNLKKTVTVTALALSLTLTGFAGTAGAAETGGKVLQEMKSMTKSNFDVVWNKDKNVPTFVSGELSGKTVKGVSQVKQYVKDNRELYKLDPNSDLTFIKKSTDDLGMTHYEFIQSVDGVPVYGARFTVHTNEQDIVTAVTGNVRPEAAKDLGKKLKAGLSKKDAIDQAWQSIDLTKQATKAKKADKQALKNSKLPDSNVKNTAEKAELVVYLLRGEKTPSSRNESGIAH